MAHVVVLGGGIGGVSMAYDMRGVCTKRNGHDVTLISDKPKFSFTPSNPWVGVNWRKREKIEVDLESHMKRKNINFIGQAAEKVIPEKNQILLVNGEVVDYDFLVIATGPRLAFEKVEGLGPHGGYTESVCHVDHAVEAGESWKKFKENPGPIIVGAVQGASCFGPAYEHAFIMHTDLVRSGIRKDVPITFVTSEPYIGHLGLGGVGDSKGMLESELRGADMKWICNAHVDRIEEGTMHVTEFDDLGNEKQKHELPFSYSMMLPPFAGVDAVQGIDGLANPGGFILVDKYQRNPTFKNIFAVGVCIAIPPFEKTPVPVGVPKTGYMIESMVDAVAHNILEICAGKEPSNIPTLSAICLADMGNRGVAFVAIPQIPPRNVAWMKGGVWVHWMKHLFEWYFLRKVRKGTISPLYEKLSLQFMGIRKCEISPEVKQGK